jgi:hypothetical protein
MSREMVVFPAPDMPVNHNVKPWCEIDAKDMRIFVIVSRRRT